MDTDKRFAFDTTTQGVIENPTFLKIDDQWKMFSGTIHDTFAVTGDVPTMEFLCHLPETVKDTAQNNEAYMEALLYRVSKHSIRKVHFPKMLANCAVWLFTASLVKVECKIPMMKRGVYLLGTKRDFSTPVHTNDMNRFIFSNDVGDFATTIV